MVFSLGIELVATSMVAASPAAIASSFKVQPAPVPTNTTMVHSQVATLEASMATMAPFTAVPATAASEAHSYTALLHSSNLVPSAITPQPTATMPPDYTNYNYTTATTLCPSHQPWHHSD